MEDVISRDWLRKLRWRGTRNMPAPMMNNPATGMGNFSLRLAQEGVNLTINYSRSEKEAHATRRDCEALGVHERLAGFGLRVGAEIQVLQNSMNGKLFLGHQGARLYLGGGMAHKIQVAVIEGGNR